MVYICMVLSSTYLSYLSTSYTDSRGRTALYHTCCQSKIPLTSFLIEQGADVMMQADNGMTPLDQARLCGKGKLQMERVYALEVSE